MAKSNIKSKQGFTIIEVVLVLAIAGLIFLMVFVALPALQRSQRDTARRNDMSRVDTSLTQYQTNHSSSSNNLPEGPVFWNGSENFDTCNNAACRFVRDYMNSGTSGTNKSNEFKDPGGTQYSLAITKNIANSSLSDGAISPSGWKSKLAIGRNDKNVEGLTIQDNNGGKAFDQYAVYVVPGSQCDDDVAIKSTTRHYSVLYRLEGAGVYCIDDQ